MILRVKPYATMAAISGISCVSKCAIADLQEFAGLFTRGLESQVYEMEPVSASRAEFIVLFHYCPYVNCWRQQGRGASEIETLCDICMEGIMR